MSARPLRVVVAALLRERTGREGTRRTHPAPNRAQLALPPLRPDVVGSRARHRAGLPELPD
jgi:hypothetical protein